MAASASALSKSQIMPLGLDFCQADIRPSQASSHAVDPKAQAPPNSNSFELSCLLACELQLSSAPGSAVAPNVSDRCLGPFSDMRL